MPLCGNISTPNGGPWLTLPLSPKQSDDMVSFTDAKEYTKLRCEAFLKQFVEPVKEMAAGFQEVLQPKNPSFSFFWDHVKGRPSNLKHLIEGNQEVDVDGLVRSAEWIGNWSESRKSIFYRCSPPAPGRGRAFFDETFEQVAALLHRFPHSTCRWMGGPPQTTDLGGPWQWL